jgi:RsiW-degrading membrane proteinase PrsW (M82 family)
MDIEQKRSMDNKTEVQPLRPMVRRNSWIKVIATSAAFYVLLLVILLLTGNSNLFPTLMMIGNFMIPVAYVAFIYERKHLSSLRMPAVSLAFLYGGLVGILAASFLEPFFITELNVGAILRIGLIEEFAKILGVLVIARNMRHDSEMDGLILGAASGMGFAALESNGYAFTAFLESNGSISAAVAVTLIRGIFSPLGHGTWTAILASVLFRESRCCNFHINLNVIGAYLLVSVLHAMWNGLPLAAMFVLSEGLAILITNAAVGIIGLAILWSLWKEAVKLQKVLPQETEKI